MPGIEVAVGFQNARAVYRRPREERAELEVTQQDPGFVARLADCDAIPALDARCAEEVARHLELFRRLHVLLLGRVCDAGADVRPALQDVRPLDRFAMVARDRFVVPPARLQAAARITISADAADASAVHALFYALQQERQRALEAWYRSCKERVAAARNVN